MRDRDESFFSFFLNKALACPLCGLQCWIKTCFHLSPSFSTSTSPPPTQCQVLLWDTQWSARVCCFVCVYVLCNGCPFGRQQYTEAPLRETGLLLNYWRTLLSHCEIHWLFSPLSLSLSVFLSLSTHTCSHTQCRMHLQIVLLLCRGWPVKTLQTLSTILLYFFF